MNDIYIMILLYVCFLYVICEIFKCMYIFLCKIFDIYPYEINIQLKICINLNILFMQ